MPDLELSEPLVEPLPNLPLLRKVLDHIDAHPEEWDQRMFEISPDWSLYYFPGCGTTRCIAGWVNFWEYGSADGSEHIFKGPAEQARALLGLTPTESSDLFFETICPDRFGVATGRQAVQIVAERIAARAGERL